MKLGYILSSFPGPDRRGTEISSNVAARLDRYGTCKVPQTSTVAPRQLATYGAFTDDWKTCAVETCLKFGSGRDFARKHL